MLKAASTLAPGEWVRLPAEPDWGLGQVQSVAGFRVTVNFEHAGKRPSTPIGPRSRAWFACLDDTDDAARPGVCALADIAWRAGEIVMRHYAQTGIDARRKSDHSPVTDADEETERYILAQLAQYAPGVAVIAEEEMAAGRAPSPARRFFLVDPLDGTREFLNRNGEFTVNIAEILDASQFAAWSTRRPKDACFLATAKAVHSKWRPCRR